MADYFFDSSAIVKRYAREKGSARVEALAANQENEIWIAEITLVEVSAALARKARNGEISERLRARSLSLFIQDCDSRYRVVPIDRLVIEIGLRLAYLYPLRGYDAVQLARALLTNVALGAGDTPLLTFLSADADLLDAASREHLLVENPGA